MRTHSIYIIKNKINDKVYIGQTIQDPKERFNQHLKPSTVKKRGSYKIYNAINKYGKENFYYQVLENDISSEEIDNKEIYYIDKYNSFKNGYNSTNGGDSKTICKIEDINTLVKMFNENKTYNYISEYFGVSNITVSRTLKSIGLSKNKKISKEYLIKNKDNMTNIEMSKELKVSTATITRAFKKFNIKRGSGCNNKFNHQNKSNIKKEDIVKLKHLSKKEIALELNISCSYAYQLFKKYNIE